jgi:DNA-binding transcriptional MerR regulator
MGEPKPTGQPQIVMDVARQSRQADRTRRNDHLQIAAMDRAALDRAADGIILELSFGDCTVQYLSRARLASLANVGLETIRFYEKQGLLPEPTRSASGYRQYTEADVERLKFIAAAKNLGFSLQETRELLSIGKHPHVVCPSLRAHAETKIEAIETKIRDLNAVRQMLMKVVRCCSNEGNACEDEDFCGRLIALADGSRQEKPDAIKGAGDCCRSR